MFNAFFSEKDGGAPLRPSSRLSPRSTRLVLFEAVLFALEQTLLTIALLTVAGLAGTARIIGDEMPMAAGWPDPGIATGLLVLPLWLLVRNVYKPGGVVPPERIRQRLQAAGMIGSCLGVAWLALGLPEPQLIVLLTILALVPVTALGIEGIVRPFLERVMGVWIPATVRGTPEFRQEVDILLRAGADFGGLRLENAGNSADKGSDDAADPVDMDGMRPPPVILAVPSHAAVGRLEAHDLGGFLMVGSRPVQPGLFSRVAKQALDTTVATFGVLLFLPVFLMIAAAIKIASPGPALYSQTRVGHNGRTFRLWKFRTMRTDAEKVLQAHLDADPAARAEWQRFFKLRHDPRIIPGIGNFLRRSSLDELPQLFNILLGDMSLVGPRPFPAYHMDRFGSEFRRLRTTVKPGLTGFWQISARSSGDVTVQETLDTYYIRNASIWFDLYIIAHTPFAMLAGRGAY